MIKQTYLTKEGETKLRDETVALDGVINGLTGDDEDVAFAAVE